MSKTNTPSKVEIRKVLSETPAERMAIPAAFADPAFNKCVMEAGATPELVEQFDRLTGCAVSRIGGAPAIVRTVDEATGFRDDQLRQFAEFVHKYIYMTLPDDAIHAFRLASMAELGDHPV